MDLELADKVAVVTGASRGIGKAIAAALAREGASVALVARDRSALEAAARDIAAATRRTPKPFVADTGEDAAVEAMVAQVLAAFGRVDILVNCAAQPAGQAKPPGLADITTEALWAEVNVKVMGYLRTAREVAKPMAAQGGGRIVNVSGLAARTTGSIIGTIRNISVAALTKNLADELAPKGVSVVCVHPGTTRTAKRRPRRRTPRAGARDRRRGGREEDGRGQPRRPADHRRRDRRPRRVPRLAEIGRDQR